MKNLICIGCGYEWEAEEAENYTCPQCNEEVAEVDETVLAKIRTTGINVVKPIKK